MVDNDLSVSDVQRQHVCSCCGHIMVPGQGSALTIETKKYLRKKKTVTSRVTSGPQQHAIPTEKRAGISKVFDCGHCGRYTKLKVPSPSPINRKKKKAQNTLSAVSQEPEQKLSANASSKKRAKNRKAGLQALLDQKKGTSSSGPGLGLSFSDFMKK